jgi:elongation factor G
MTRQFSLEKTRNIGIMAHIDAGKTTTTERILYYTGISHRIGEVDEGTAIMDWMQEEQERGITITSAATTCFWEDHRINIIDTPGHVDFTVEVERSLRVLDGAIVIICAVAGVQPQTETIWRQCNKYSIPRILLINKMDRTGADFLKALSTIKEQLHANIIPLQIPYGKEQDYKGFYDLLTYEKVTFEEGDLGTTIYKEKFTQKETDDLKKYRDFILETISEYNDEILTELVAGNDIPLDKIRSVIRELTIKNIIIPVICGSSFKNKGIQALLNAVIHYLPAPSDLPSVQGIDPDTDKPVFRQPKDEEYFSALIFKIMTDPHVGQLVYFRTYSGSLKTGTKVYNSRRNSYERVGRLLKMHANKREDVECVYAGDIAASIGLKNVFTGDTICDDKAPIILESIEFPEPVLSVAIEPKTNTDREKLVYNLDRLCREDPTFKISFNKETGETIVSGMGELHLEIILARLLREFKVEASIGKPQVAYKETVKGFAQGEGKYIKQTGGKGQYGHVILEVKHSSKVGLGVSITNAIRGGSIPSEYFSSISSGIKEASETGVVQGFPVVDVDVVILDGSYHPVDSSEIAFKIAASMAFKDALKKAGPVIMEPIVDLEVVTPKSYSSEIMNDLSSRRGRVVNMKMDDFETKIYAHVPLANMFGYTTTIRSLSQGRANYHMKLFEYREVSEKMFEKKF